MSGLEPDDVAEHWLWEWAARRGLIDGVGGAEWHRRHTGTDFAGDDWIADHEWVVRALDGDFTGALVVPGVAEALVRAVRRGA